MEYILKATDIYKNYHNPSQQATVHALNGVDAVFEAGCMVAIVGSSGSGKSTLLHCLSGLDTPDHGTVTFQNHPLSHMKETQISRLYQKHIGFVFQRYHLIESLTAEENICLPPRLAGQHIEPAILNNLFHNFGLNGKEKNYPNQLSGGEQQRVALIRALIKNPDIIFADEPTGALDSINGHHVLTALRRATAQGTTVIIVTHDIKAASIADSIIVLRDGKITHRLNSSSPETILVALTAKTQEA